MSVDHWMMFGTFAQQDVFAYPTPDTYRGVIINANMTSYAPAGIASFLHEKTASSTYIIDPLTHAFQHDPQTIANKDGEPKPSIRNLAEAYGEPVSGTCGSHPLLPDDLSDEGKLSEFVERCLAYQTTHLASYMLNTDAAKYLEDDEVVVPPYAVVAPYFFMSETTVDDWLPLNIKCLEHALSCRRGEAKLFASIVIDQGVLEDPALRAKVADAYVRLEVDGFLLWIDNFDEQAASRSELVALVDLAKRLRREGAREVINTHGGFFSILAASALGGGAFSGVTHGPEFGEYRGVVPVGGGIPISRYYVPQLHARVRYRDALRMLRAKGWLDSAEAFHEYVCECEVCKETLAGDAAGFQRYGESTVKTVRRKSGLVRIDFPTSDARDRCLRHYLQRKRREYLAASTCDGEQLITSVSRGYHQFKRAAGLEGVKHLRLWLRAFGTDIKPESHI